MRRTWRDRRLPPAPARRGKRRTRLATGKERGLPRAERPMPARPETPGRGAPSRGARRLFGRAGPLVTALLEHLVDEAVFDGLAPVHETVAVGVLLDPLDALAGVLGQDFVESITGFEHFLGVDLHVRRLPLKAAERLVDHHAGMREAEALAGSPCGQQNGSHAGGLPRADRGH